MAYAETPLALHIGTGFLIGLALAGTSFGVVLAVVARAMPPEKRSIALGLATAAGSMGQFIMLPLAQFLINRFGWQGALLGLALVVSLIVPLSATMKGRPPAQPGAEQSLGAALKEARRERSLHLLFWGYFACGFQL